MLVIGADVLEDQSTGAYHQPRIYQLGRFGLLGAHEFCHPCAPSPPPKGASASATYYLAATGRSIDSSTCGRTSAAHRAQDVLSANFAADDETGAKSHNRNQQYDTSSQDPSQGGGAYPGHSIVIHSGGSRPFLLTCPLGLGLTGSGPLSPFGGG